MYASNSSGRLTPKEAWEIARSQLRLQMTKGTYDTWVRDTVCLASEDNAFVVGCTNAYAKDWLSMRLRPMIKRTLASIVGHAVDVTFVVQAVPAADEPAAASAGPQLRLDGMSQRSGQPAEIAGAPEVMDMPAIEGGGAQPPLYL